MAKFLVARTDCDYEDAETPDVFVLRLEMERVVMMARLVEYVKEQHERRNSIKSIEFEFDRGHWMISGDEDWARELIGDNNGVIAEFDDIAAIVGEDALAERMIVEPDGDVSFICIHGDSDLYVRARPINITELEKAFARASNA